MHKLIAACGAAFLMVSGAQAGEVPKAVKDACSGDYDKYCSMHKPESDAVRDCMADAFERLSDPCVAAILDSSLVDEQAAPKDVAKLTNKRKSKSASARRDRRDVAQRRVTPRRVAGYIKRGTGIAERYVAKYTHLAFARAFR